MFVCTATLRELHSQPLSLSLSFSPPQLALLTVESSSAALDAARDDSAADEATAAEVVNVVVLPAAAPTPVEAEAELLSTAPSSPSPSTPPPPSPASLFAAVKELGPDGGDGEGEGAIMARLDADDDGAMCDYIDTEDQSSALWWACVYRLECLALALAARASARVANSRAGANRVTALWLACMNDMPAVAQRLLDIEGISLDDEST